MTNRLHKTLLIAPLLLTTILPANAQYGRRNDRFNNGVRQGGRGGQYYDNRNDRDRRDQGGIGPGKGALIGVAGGAALGAIFGKSLKGTIIGGAAGAGVGAIAGQVAQSNRDDNRRHHRR
ncbi:MAG TPA: hypothetical protein VGB69_08015 [Edaphobacter sp.]